MSAANGHTSESTRPRASLYDRMLPASAAGMIGAAGATAASLPLRSPDDLFANAASVAVVSVIGATVLGCVWVYMDRFAPRQQLTVWVAFCASAFVTTVIAAAVAERVGELSNVASFTAPLAGIMLGISAVAAPIVQRYIAARWLRAVVPLLGIALVIVGVLLTVNEVGFNEPPSLSLPPPP